LTQISVDWQSVLKRQSTLSLGEQSPLMQISLSGHMVLELQVLRQVASTQIWLAAQSTFFTQLPKTTH